MAIEDSGFEVRDSIAWMYGSGFPKSLDISKAIDKGTGENKQRQLKFVEWMRSTGMTASQANKILQDCGAISPNGTMASHFFEKVQPAIATADLFDKLRPFLPEVPEEIERLVAERTGIEWTAYKQREVVGQKSWSNSVSHFVPGEDHSERVNLDITLAATKEAKQWKGWGTALKPAFEPIIVARKPLIGTVAENVLTHGTGGLNIDGSRIGTGTGEKRIVSYPDIRGDNYQQGKESYSERGTVEREVTDKGRWPANVILDEYTAGLLDEQSGQSKPKPEKVGPKGGSGFGYFDDEKTAKTQGRWPEDPGGGASRFFYVAKASKRDRNEGLEGIEGKEIGAKGNGLARTCAICGASILNPCECPDRTFVNPTRQNFHPTVKPTDLMRYLVKLVTPPNGIVLDPFTGSGSTGKAAILEGFRFIGIELTEDYYPIIEGRLNHAEQVKQAAEKKKKRNCSNAQILIHL